MSVHPRTTSIPIVLLLLFVVFLFKLSHSASVLNLSKHPKLVIISFDGFRADYLDRVNTPTLDQLVKEGVSVPYMRSQFTTKTFPNHQSISTGLFAESHGITDNTVFDPELGRNETGFTEYNDAFWNFSPDVVPIWTLNEWAGDARYSGVQFPGSNQHYGKNCSLPKHWLSYNGSRPFETRMDLVREWLTHRAYPANLVFMYFEQPDSAGHDFGPNSQQVKDQVARMDGMVAYLIAKLKKDNIYEDVNIILLSDHGMEEVNVGNRINLTEIVDVDRNAYDRYGGTPVYQIAPKPGREDEVYKAFKDASIGKQFSVYRRHEIPAQWHYQKNRRISEILVVADPGFVFEDFKRNVVDPSLKFGVHGYDNNAPSMHAFFIAHGPHFKKGLKAEAFDNVDLFPLIANLMGFGLRDNSFNGTIDKVSQMLGKGCSLQASMTIIIGLISTFNALFRPN